MPSMMRPLSSEERLRIGLLSASGHMYQQDKIWSRHSNDKVDIAGTLTRVLRTLHKSLPLDEPLTALSIGSSNEPQFRILESSCRGGLYLLDIEEPALAVVHERSQRQNTRQVKTILGDYRQALCDEAAVRHFREEQLSGNWLKLITLHHSLYYSSENFWPDLLVNLYEQLLATALEPGPTGAIHAVLMANRDANPTSTTWLYNHFAHRFFGCHNHQDLRACAEGLRNNDRLADAQVLSKSSQVEFFVDDFERFMAVVWMILLHPKVHNFTEEQQREVTEFVYTNLWSQGLPLVQTQDHVVIYRGKGFAGLI